MPLFKQKNSSRSPTSYDKTNNSSLNNDGGHANSNGNSNANTNYQDAPGSPPTRPQLIFHCQLAHGSPTGLISGFSNVKELYQKIAECYELPPTDVRFLHQILQISFRVLFYFNLISHTSPLRPDTGSTGHGPEPLSPH